MSDLLLTGFYFIVAIVVHELGHLFGYWWYGIRPKVKITWAGSCIMSSPKTYFLKIWQFYMILWLGVFSGLICLLVAGVLDGYVLAGYVFISSMDIANMMNYLGLSKKEKNMRIVDLEVKNMQKFMSEVLDEVKRQ